MDFALVVHYHTSRMFCEMSKLRISIASLAKLTDSTREDVRRWLLDAGHDPLSLVPEKHDEYLRIIESHKKEKVQPGEGESPHRDRDGLTWLESKQKEEARKLKRENVLAEKALSEDWMTTVAHHQVLANLCSKLESAPDTFKSQLGLTAAQVGLIQKGLDEIRFDAAAETKRALLDGKKKAVKEAA